MITYLKRVFINVVLFTVAMCAAFGLGEIVVRLIFKTETMLFPRYHTDYEYGKYKIRGIRPNSEFTHTSVDGSWRFRTNNRGFRNEKDVEYIKASDLFRVLSLGDSHTQGYEVMQDETFSAVLERYLSKHRNKVEVINAGVSGFSTSEALVLLENEGLRYAPDLVVLGFFRNDFEDNIRAGLFKLSDDRKLVEQKFEHLPGVKIQNAIYAFAPVRWLGENSYFYSLLFNKVWMYFKVAMSNEARKGLGSANSPSNDPASSLEYAVATRNNQSTYDINLAAALIERMDRACKKAGARFIVVDVPTKVGRYGFESSVPPALEQKLAAAHIEYIRSGDVLAGAQGVVATHVANGDTHIAAFTHALIGIAVGRQILRTEEATTVGSRPGAVPRQ